MRLGVWKISTRSYLCQEFEKQLKNLSQEQGKGHLRQIMNPLGEGGLAGVLGDKLIPFVIRDSSKGDMNLRPFGVIGQQYRLIIDQLMARKLEFTQEYLN